MKSIEYIKQCLRDGKWMNRFSLGAAVLAGFLYLCMPFDAIKVVFALSSIISAAISGVVFNLRDKAVQYGLGLIAESKKPEMREKQAKECAEKLTAMLMWGLLCSVMCVAAAYLQPDSKEQVVNIGSLKYYNAVCCALFAFCCMKYFYLIFAFEDLEFIRLRHAVETRNKMLENASLQKMSEDKKRIPDSLR